VHDVEVERHAPRVGVGVLRALLARGAARVGDEQVEPAERVARVGNEALERRRVGDVDRARVDCDAAPAELVAVRASSSPSRAQIASAQPSAASRSAIARPMPRVAPVMNRVFPVSDMMETSLLPKSVSDAGL
jgi:hypothetical protein